MRRLTKQWVVVLALITLCAGVALAGRSVVRSIKTADAGITTGSGEFMGFIITPDGTNDVTLSIYDNTAGSGTKMLPTMIFAGDGGTQAWSVPGSDRGLEYYTGIYADITTSGTVEYAIFFRSGS